MFCYFYQKSRAKLYTLVFYKLTEVFTSFLLLVKFSCLVSCMLQNMYYVVFLYFDITSLALIYVHYLKKINKTFLLVTQRNYYNSIIFCVL